MLRQIATLPKIQYENTGFVQKQLTELPGKAGAALQRWVVEGVSAVHQPCAGQYLDGPQGQQVGILQPQAPCSILDTSL